ncbi:MAG: hypothetical protein LKF71_01315 [Oscillospiraceae bacterium]|jgi:hypothetical protein|nr:hypothetical protein [Oscillospiraceae bacterium]
MKKLNVVMLVCAVAVTALLVVTLSITSEVRETKQTPSSTFVYSSANEASSQEMSQITAGTISSAATSSASSGGRQAIYLVKTHAGKIGIFHVGETVPFRVLEVPVSNLPEADQKLLKIGISVQSSEELQRIVEDYVG